ncbi:MAG: hypothetical protein HONDAALG_01695 [Gammaproteobacteria bacterium]|nr:hypothetical protein [Gammaproteobacteria bacterium]
MKTLRIKNQFFRFTKSAGAIALVGILMGVNVIDTVSQTAHKDMGAEREQTLSVERDPTPGLQADKQPSVTLSRHQLRRPKSLDDLRAFAIQRFSRIASAEAIEPALADNQPAVCFTTFDLEARTDYLLVDNGNELSLITRRFSDVGLTEIDLPEEVDGEGDVLKSDGDNLMKLIAPQIASCAGYSSPGNPYPCCAAGNCTWWAWDYTSRVWQQPLPGFSKNSQYPSGDAKYWAGHAKQQSWPVSPDPGSRAIAVSSWKSSWGHVFPVHYLGWNRLIGNEMNCGQSGVKAADYPIYDSLQRRYTADQGFIYPKPTQTRPLISYTVSPQLWRGGTYQILFGGQNFSSDTIVDVRTPSNDWVSLKGTQVQVTGSQTLWITATLGAPGWWQFKVVDPKGQRSNWVYLYVN